MDRFVIALVAVRSLIVASSALNTARETGGVTGVALLGAIAAPDLATGTPLAMLIALIVCVLAAIAAATLIPNRT